MKRNGIDDLFEKIRQGDDHVLKNIYEENRSKFVNWMKSNNKISNDEAIDIYQKSFTVMYLNIRDGKVTKLNSSISTYIFGIGKNLVKELFRKNEYIVKSDEISEIELLDNSMDEAENNEQQKSLVKSILSKLEEPCKSILLMYYFKNFSMESIASNLGYKNESVAKKKKCLCLKKIREEMQQMRLKNE